MVSLSERMTVTLAAFLQASFFETGVHARINGAMLQSSPDGSTVNLVGEMKSEGIMLSSVASPCRPSLRSTPALPRTESKCD